MLVFAMGRKLFGSERVPFLCIGVINDSLFNCISAGLSSSNEYSDIEFNNIIFGKGRESV